MAKVSSLNVPNRSQAIFNVAKSLTDILDRFGSHVPPDIVVAVIESPEYLEAVSANAQGNIELLGVDRRSMRISDAVQAEASLKSMGHEVERHGTVLIVRRNSEWLTVDAVRQRENLPPGKDDDPPSAADAILDTLERLGRVPEEWQVELVRRIWG